MKREIHRTRSIFYIHIQEFINKNDINQSINMKVTKMKRNRDSKRQERYRIVETKRFKLIFQVSNTEQLIIYKLSKGNNNVLFC